MKRIIPLITALLLLVCQVSEAESKTLSVLTIGNSFADNALTYLPGLAKEAGHTLTVGRANLGGCSLERHWKHAAAFIADPKSKEGSPYGGGKRSLADILNYRKWDFITIQQASMKSHDPATYYPYVRNLVKYVRELAPDSKILVHQTWAYRVDDPRFSPLDKKRGPSTQKEMYEQVRKAYHALAEEFDLGIIPSGDSMYLADTDSKWGFQAASDLDVKKIDYPELPEQKFSLHKGWVWRKSPKSGERLLRMDGHHASVAGCYLIGCTWFEALFGESVVNNSFALEKLDSDYTIFLQETAHRAVSER